MRRDKQGRGPSPSAGSKTARAAAAVATAGGGGNGGGSNGSAHKGSAQHQAKERPQQPSPPGANGSAPRAVAAGELVVGILAGFGPGGVPLVAHSRQDLRNHQPARSMVGLDSTHVGRDVVLAFEQGDPSRPIVLGVVARPEVQAPTLPAASPAGVVREPEGAERLVVTADKEIVLRCGLASITLTHAGKVLIRGAYLSSHSSGVNRIKGGSVQIN